MSDPSCPVCDGFGWMPAGHAPGWYARDWRLLLDATVAWEPCPACHQQESPTLDQVVVRLLERRLAERFPAPRRRESAWACGRDESGQVVWWWRDLVCIEPGPLLDPINWSLVSHAGVIKGLSLAECRRHVRQAGAPDLEPSG